jgi:hypothetical protein
MSQVKENSTSFVPPSFPPGLSTDQKLELIFQQNAQILDQRDAQILALKTRIDQLEDTIDNILAKTTEDNIVFRGLQVPDTETPYSYVCNLFNYFKPQRPHSLVSAKYVSKTRNVIIVKTGHPSDKVFFKNAKAMLEKGVRVSDDLPPRLQETRNALLKRRRELLNAGSKIVKVVRGSLLVDDRDWYDYDRESKSVIPRSS